MTNKEPINCRTFSTIGRLPFDNIDLGGYWALLEERTITIAKQKPNEDAENIIAIPRRKFEALIDWYVEGIIPATERRKPANTIKRSAKRKATGVNAKKSAAIGLRRVTKSYASRVSK